MSSGFSLLTWNVNSVRARLDNVLEYIDEHEPDVVCLQETKVDNSLFPRVPFMEYGYECTLHGTKGYAGVATLTKQKPGEVIEGFAEGERDKACRILNVKVGDTRIYNLYVPNGTSLDSENFPYKLEWYRRLRDELDARHSVDEQILLCGDFNVAPDARDVWDVEAMKGGTHFTAEEHEVLENLKGFGLHDCFRKFEDGAGHFTWYDYRNASFERGHGLRIDHVYVTPPLYERCERVVHDVEPRKQERASDHLPVRAYFKGALLALLVPTLLALALPACTTARYRYDRIGKKKAKDGEVELKTLEDLIADGRDRTGMAPGEALGIDRDVVDYDFANDKDEYTLGPNDVLNIFVMDHPEMSSQRVNIGEISGTTIAKDGHIYMPVIGKVNASGMSLVEFRDQLIGEASKYIVDPQVSVEILTYESKKFFVLGEVTRPGAFPVDGSTTLLEGLGLAGGVKPTGNLEAAYVARDGQLMPINLADVLLRGDVSRNVFMHHGDVVYVPDTSDQKVFVLGEVETPTAVPIARNRITLAEALAMAGGPTRAESRKEIAVLRGGFAKPVVYTMDMEEALLYDEQILLQPGDRVVVAPTGLATSSRYMRQILPFLQGAQAVGIAAQGAGNVTNSVAATQNN